jgi:hypothetical protein
MEGSGDQQHAPCALPSNVESSVREHEEPLDIADDDEQPRAAEAAEASTQPRADAADGEARAAPPLETAEASTQPRADAADGEAQAAPPLASTPDPPLDEDECAICFDAIPVDDQLLLPCRCRVLYCLHCWDRALAAAFNDSGRARCPTCRSPVRVDFDPEAASGRGRLLFSKDDDGHTSRGDVVNRLAEQAAPLMARSLREYGEKHPALRKLAQDPAAALSRWPTRELKTVLEGAGGDPEGCFEKSDLVDRLVETAGTPGQLSAYLVATVRDLTRLGVAAEGEPSEAAAARGGEGEAGPGPASVSVGAKPKGGGDTIVRCVCGGQLEQLSGRSRSRMLFSSHYPHLGPERLELLLDHVLRSGESSIVCDLCDDKVPPHAPVYTCNSCDRTILHPTTYDVCTLCFVRFAVEGQGDEGLAIERRN